MSRSKILAATVFRFPVLGNLSRSDVSGAYKKTLRLRKRGAKHDLVLHFVGRPAYIRATEGWNITELKVERDPATGRVEHHFKCTPTEKPVTVDSYRLSNGAVSFYRGTRRNGSKKTKAGCPRAFVAA